MKRALVLLFLSALSLFVAGCGGGGSDSEPTQQWSITAAGGTFQSSNRVVTVVVPAGAVAAATNVTATQLATAPTPPVGHAFVANSGWSFTHANFTAPVALKIAFAAGSVPAGAVSKIKVFKLAAGGNAWSQLDTVVDAGARTATVSINSFSSYALFYPTGTGWTWTNAGGVFDFENFTATLEAGSVSETLEVQPRRTPTEFTPPTGWVAVPHSSFDLGSSNPDVHTTSPVSFTASYTAADVPAEVRGGIKMFYKENVDLPWVQLTTVADVPNLKATAQHSRLGTFALFYPSIASIFYVEDHNIQGSNNRILDIYAPSTTGEQHLATATVDDSHRLISDTYRDDDRSFLEARLDGSTWTANLYNVETHAFPSIHNVSAEAGWRYESILLTRSTRRGPARDVVVSTQEVNLAGTAARDRLTLYRTGESPRVLISVDRDPSSAPAILRGMDNDADGNVLAWLGTEGLVKFTAGGRTVLAGVDFFPQQARFSPTGSKVLFLQLGGAGIGWKIVDAAGASGPVAVNAITSNNLARWGADDGELLVSFTGPREIKSLTLSNGVFRTVAVTGARTNMFVDIGIPE